MSGGTAACAVRAGRLQLVYLFIRFPHPLVIKALLVRGQHLEEVTPSFNMLCHNFYTMVALKQSSEQISSLSCRHKKERRIFFRRSC